MKLKMVENHSLTVQTKINFLLILFQLSQNCTICVLVDSHFIIQKVFTQERTEKNERSKNFLSLFVVLGHVQVGNFFLVFSLHTHHFQGDTIKSRQRFDHVVEERKEIQMNQSFPLNSLQSFSK
jgi:hypothetical protein